MLTTLVLALTAALTAPTTKPAQDCPAPRAEATERGEPAADAPLQAQIDSLLPTAQEERFLAVPWRTNLMAARREAQQTGKPIFLWIMVGNPQGCT